MYFKGPILVFTSISLLASAALIRLNQVEPPPPDRISTVAGAPDPCAQHDFATLFTRSRCGSGPRGKQQTAWERRNRAGGALFLSPTRN